MICMRSIYTLLLAWAIGMMVTCGDQYSVLRELLVMLKWFCGCYAGAEGVIPMTALPRIPLPSAFSMVASHPNLTAAPIR